MTAYIARMMDSISGGEGAYRFEHREDLMSRPADDIVAAFFEYAEREVFKRGHVRYELNGAVKNQQHNIVVAIGSMHMQGDADSQPFTIFIAPAP
jgi:hypothetical protein